MQKKEPGADTQGEVDVLGAKHRGVERATTNQSRKHLPHPGLQPG